MEWVAEVLLCADRRRSRRGWGLTYYNCMKTVIIVRHWCHGDVSSLARFLIDPHLRIYPTRHRNEFLEGGIHCTFFSNRRFTTNCCRILTGCILEGLAVIFASTHLSLLVRSTRRPFRQLRANDENNLLLFIVVFPFLSRLAWRLSVVFLIFECRTNAWRWRAHSCCTLLLPCFRHLLLPPSRWGPTTEEE